MRLQNIEFAAPAVGANRNVPVSLEPGLCGMVVGASFTLLAAAEGQALVTIVETGLANSICAFGEIVLGATTQNVNAAFDVSSVPTRAAAVMTDIGVGVALPRIVCQQNFIVTLGFHNIQAGDTVSGGRLVVAFGALWELLAL